MFLRNAMYFVTAALARCRYSSALRGGGQLRQPAVALLLELQRGMGARQLALQQRDLVVPRHRHELHVAQAPGVVLLADAGRTGLRRRLPLEPLHESGRRGAGAADRRLEAPRRTPARSCRGLEIRDLLRHRSGAGDPQIARVADQVHARLCEQRRDRAELAGEARFVRGDSGNA